MSPRQFWLLYPFLTVTTSCKILQHEIFSKMFKLFARSTSHLRKYVCVTRYTMLSKLKKAPLNNNTSIFCYFGSKKETLAPIITENHSCITL